MTAVPPSSSNVRRVSFHKIVIGIVSHISAYMIGFYSAEIVPMNCTQPVSFNQGKNIIRKYVVENQMSNQTDDDDDDVNPAKEWWVPHAEEISHAYSAWPIAGGDDRHLMPNYTDPSMYSWCQMEHQPNTSALNGLIYIKSHKASSSTCSGVARTIAHNVARRIITNGTDENRACIHHAWHATGDKNDHANRNETHSLLWTFVRDPAARDLSDVYYFRVSRGMEPTDDNVLEQLRLVQGKQTRYLSPKAKRTDRSWPGYVPEEQPEKFVSQLREDIIDNYEFIGITERMEESLAVMTLLWHLPASDVVTLSTRRSGGYDAGERMGQCIKIPKANRTPAVQEYFAKEHKENNMDFFLYQTALRSLDKTIEALGPDRVAARVAEIQKLQRIANERCESEAVFPCSDNGELQREASAANCYASDAGCAHECIHNVLEEHRLATLDG